MQPLRKPSLNKIDIDFQRGLELHRKNQIPAAEKIYRENIKKNPRHFDSIHMLGVVCRQKKHYEEALKLLGQAVSINKNNSIAYSNLGNALNDTQRFEEAAAAFTKAIELNPNYATAYLNRSNTYYAAGRLDQALEDAQNAMRLSPNHPEALRAIGNILNQLDRHGEAISFYQKALELIPNDPSTLCNLGSTFLDMQDYAQAEPALNAAIRLQPDFFHALNNRANLHTALKRPEMALLDIEASLRLQPNFTEALLNRGNVLQDLKRFSEAIASYDQAIAQRPDYAAAFNNKGNALKEISQHSAALLCYDRALEIDPTYAEAHYHRALALNDLLRYGEATSAFEKAVFYKEDHPLLFGQWIWNLMMVCDWKELTSKVERLAKKIRDGKNASTTFSILACGLTPDLVKQSTITFIKEKYWDRSHTYSFPKPHTHPKIRVGYFSSDFRSHAVSQLAVGVFESHDRNKFDIIGLNISSLPPDDMTTRVERAFGGLVQLGSLPVQEIVQKVRAINLDIAIDLNGHTKGSNTDIFAHRIAPIQINYLGYPGTSGAPYMDYILGDPIIIPPEHFDYYTEKVAHLPDTYLPNDSQKIISGNLPSREEVGLPRDAFVFCCFNNSYKFNEETFSAWMRILSRLDNSVLWLSEVNETAKGHLKSRSMESGINPDRILFASRTPNLEDHLSRLRLADLFLDTTRYNAHTTASDALWSGLPVLTCLGDSFPGRVAASLLHAIGLPQLVAKTLADYEAMAIYLATHPDDLQKLRATLAQNKTTHPLFDTKLFTRNLEAILTKMWGRYLGGLPADHLGLL